MEFAVSLYLVARLSNRMNEAGDRIVLGGQRSHLDLNPLV